MENKKYPSSELYPLSKQRPDSTERFMSGRDKLLKQIEETKIALQNKQALGLSEEEVAQLERKLDSQTRTYERLEDYASKQVEPTIDQNEEANLVDTKEDEVTLSPEEVRQLKESSDATLVKALKLTKYQLGKEDLDETKRRELAARQTLLVELLPDEKVEKIMGMDLQKKVPVINFEGLPTEVIEKLEAIREKIRKFQDYHPDQRLRSGMERKFSRLEVEAFNKQIRDLLDRLDEPSLRVLPKPVLVNVQRTLAKMYKKEYLEDSSYQELQVVLQRLYKIKEGETYEQQVARLIEDEDVETVAININNYVEEQHAETTQKELRRELKQLRSNLDTLTLNDLSEQIDRLYLLTEEAGISDEMWLEVEETLDLLETKKQSLETAEIVDSFEELNAIEIEQENSSLLDQLLEREFTPMDSVRREYTHLKHILTETQDDYAAYSEVQRAEKIDGLSRLALHAASQSPRRQDITEIQDLLRTYFAQEKDSYVLGEVERLYGELEIFQEKTKHRLQVADKRGYEVNIESPRDISLLQGTPEYYASGLAQKYSLEEYMDTLSPSLLGVYEAEKDKPVSEEEYEAKIKGENSEEFVVDFFASPLVESDVQEQVLATQKTNGYTLLDDTYKADVLVFTKGREMSQSQSTQALNLIKDINELLDMQGNKSVSEIHTGNRVWHEYTERGKRQAEFYEMDKLTKGQVRELQEAGTYDKGLIHQNVLPDYKRYAHQMESARKRYTEVLAKTQKLNGIQKSTFKKIARYVAEHNEITLSTQEYQPQSRKAALREALNRYRPDTHTAALAQEYLTAYVLLGVVRKRIMRQASRFVQEEQLDFAVQGLQVKSGDQGYYDYIRPENEANNEAGVVRPIFPHRRPAQDGSSDLSLIRLYGLEADVETYNEAMRRVLDLQK